MLDSRDAVVTDNRYGNASVIFTPTYEKLAKLLSENRGIPVVTGFIGSTIDGSTTTLGRNGTDYTASLVGAAVGAEEVEIWTDVDGVLSSDPRLVENAFVVPELNFQEAMELSYFGAEVIHPSTLIPAVEKGEFVTLILAEWGLPRRYDCLVVYCTDTADDGGFRMGLDLFSEMGLEDYAANDDD